MTIEIYKETYQPKADSLFEGKDPSGTKWCPNSEHWWTSLFSMLLLYLSRKGLSGKIPLKRLVRFNDSETVFETVDLLDYAGVAFSNLAIEANVKRVAETLLKTTVPSATLSKMVPDITIVRPGKESAKGRVILIENKAVSAGIDGLRGYPSIRDWLEPDWNVQLIVLVSLGYSNPLFWTEVAHNKKEFLFILWEDVLKVLDELDELEVFRSLFDIKLKPYYEQVKPSAS